MDRSKVLYSILQVKNISKKDRNQETGIDYSFHIVNTHTIVFMSKCGGYDFFFLFLYTYILQYYKYGTKGILCSGVILYILLC